MLGTATLIIFLVYAVAVLGVIGVVATVVISVTSIRRDVRVIRDELAQLRVHMENEPYR